MIALLALATASNIARAGDEDKRSVAQRVARRLSSSAGHLLPVNILRVVDNVRAVGAKAVIKSSSVGRAVGRAGAIMHARITGRPRRVVLSGHGEYQVGLDRDAAGNKTGRVRQTRVPKGCTLTLYGKIGSVGGSYSLEAIIRDRVPEGAYRRVYREGDLVADLTLHRGDGLATIGWAARRMKDPWNNKTVERPTYLSELFAEAKAPTDFHWNACLSVKAGGLVRGTGKDRDPVFDGYRAIPCWLGDSYSKQMRKAGDR